jgi:hypothetical protein
MKTKNERNKIIMVNMIWVSISIVGLVLGVINNEFGWYTFVQGMGLGFSLADIFNQ